MLTEHEELLVGELPQHPAWSGLREIADERHQQKFDNFAKALIRGDDVTAEELAYDRGYYECLKYIFRELERLRKVRSEILG